MPITVHRSSGSMNRRVTIERPIDTPDGGGGFIRDWEPYFATWANVVGSGGTEPYFAEQVYPHAQYTVTIRFRRSQPVTDVMRVHYGTHVLNIRSVVDTKEQHVELVLHCEELQAEGSQL